MESKNIALLVPLVTAVIGVLIGGLSKAVLDRYAAFRESQAVAAALRAEIDVVLDIIERRRHLENLGRTISYLRCLTRPPMDTDLYEVVGRSQDRYPVFEAHCEKLGLLGDAAAPVVATYTRLKALDTDLSGIPERHRVHPFPLEQLVHAHEGIRDLLQQAMTQGKVATAKLRAHEQRRFGFGRFGFVRRGST